MFGGFGRLLRCRMTWGAAVLTLGLPTSALADTLSVTATGTIGSSCSIAVKTAFPAANLGASGSVAASADIGCNAKFKLNATSTNGSMKASGAAAPGFSNTIPYSLSVSVPIDQGGAISATCPATQLVAGQSACALSPLNATGLSSVNGTAVSQIASLTAAWTLPTVKLIAGAYSDTITLLIATLP